MLTFAKICMVSLVAVLARWCVSLGDYSGAGKPPMFGDYEAQRHWQEVAVNLPVQEWYKNSSRNDLMYWGLDYPPLTAYHSYLCGLVAKYLKPDWVALNISRGYESYEHKLFMRYSVLLVDVFIFFPAVYWTFAARKPHLTDQDASVKSYLLMLLYPGLILIDYGHFQYNCVSLGLALLAVTSLATNHDVLGSVLFCLALNYKQMELYHAMPFFCFLLGTCLRDIRRGGFWRLVQIGLAVLATFATCWAPFLLDLDTAKQVLNRLFPFARGVFEDKVANVWCSLSVLIKWKQMMTLEQILKMCLCVTGACLLPSSVDLLCRPSFTKFRYALVNSSLVFFLFSFQVHEKSILIPALIVCTLIPDCPFWCFWFLQVSTFSMLPLLVKDGQLVPYIAFMLLYPLLFNAFNPIRPDTAPPTDTQVWVNIFVKLAFCISCVGQVFLSLALVIFPPPAGLPDLFPLVISVFSCAHFLLFAAYFHYCQFTAGISVHHSHKTKAANGKNSKTVSKAMNKATVENTTKHKSMANKLKLRKKKHD
ncbi:dolichyl pyrophosphate Man9GlcNAc2 alpha-1,3-glucosyltransferase-like [Mya arenaria]|uniref:dolichyl pyrophosphate Man9GlcNAc2 alpha-1,3-glucosyltransferase-like n=1 Tax=Mya arenaria TaxID=6604 RepID=UPI0022E6693B|nr:dolichyl pyrophosphate Man9GlcNAc2 alpha-1,3-glucosyltransferase-like [Mya arenaria]